MKKISKLSEETLEKIKRKGIATFTGFFTQKRIIITFEDNTSQEYYFKSEWGYRKLYKFLRELDTPGAG